MLDRDFLQSLGIREALLPPEARPEGVLADLPADLPVAGPAGVPAELLELEDEALEKLIKELHTKGTPYVFLMPNGIHKAAIFPEEGLGLYDLELSFQDLLSLIVLWKHGAELTAYETRDGLWYPETADPSRDIIVQLEDLERSE
jgi:hypothetical protein